VSKLEGEKILLGNSGGKPLFLTCSILTDLVPLNQAARTWKNQTARHRTSQEEGLAPRCSWCLPDAAVGVLDADQNNLFGETVVLFEVEGGDTDGASWG